MIKHALQYLERASIIPLNGKVPYLYSWKEFQERKPTVEEVTRWWTEHPEANIGIITGKISNLTVVDVDSELIPDGLPNTVIARTGHGWHYYYQYEPGISNRARVMENVDLRGDGGYVVAPPSIHPETQKPYEWIKRGDIQPFPKHLFGISQKNTDWTKVAKGADEGQRNETAARYIGKLMTVFDRETWENTVWETARLWNEKNNPPMSERELRTTYESIKTRAQKNERLDEPSPEEIKIVHISETENLFLSEKKYLTLIPMVDETIGGGLEEGDLVVISAPTGMGKTTLMQTITKNLSQQSIPSLWFSYEVMMKNLWKNFQDMGLTKNSVVFSPFKNENGSMGFLRKAIAKAKEVAPVKVVFIDHLGYLVPALNQKDIGQNYPAYLQQICKELKSTAIQEGVIIILAAHMRKTDNPKIEDIRDSAGIAQEADTVLMLNREALDSETEYYGNRTQITIVKNRKTGKTTRRWFKLEGRSFVEDDAPIVAYAKKLFKAKPVYGLNLE